MCVCVCVCVCAHVCVCVCIHVCVCGAWVHPIHVEAVFCFSIPVGMECSAACMVTAEAGMTLQNRGSVVYFQFPSNSLFTQILSTHLHSNSEF